MVEYRVPSTKEDSPLADQMRRMGSERLEIALQHAHTIELTYGCSVGCYFCGCNVPKGVRAHMSVEIVDFLGENFQHCFELRTPYLSGSNDALDWESRGKNFDYAYRVLTNEEKNWGAGASTAVPPGKEELARLCVESGYIGRISVSTMNEKRLKSKVPTLFEECKKKKVDTYYPEMSLVSMGRNAKGEYEADSLSNRVGVTITPLGIYNYNMTHPSKRFPTGEIQTLIDPDNFKVIEWGRRKDLPLEIWDYWIYGKNGAFPVQWLGEGDKEVVDSGIAKLHMFLKMFYRMDNPGWRVMQNSYLKSARSVLKKNVPHGDISRKRPSNEASGVRLEECARLADRMVKGLSKKTDFWSRRKRKLLEEELVV